MTNETDRGVAVASRAICTAKIRPDSPRHANWIHILGTDTAPIEGPTTGIGSAPGIERAQFYKLQVKALDADQRERLFEYLSAGFGAPRAEVERDIDDPEHGVPVLADDVTVFIDARKFI